MTAESANLAEIMKPSEKGLLGKYITIFFVISGYWIISICTVFVNKRLLSDIHLDAPMFIALYQTAISVVICLGMKLASKIWPERCSFPKVQVFDKNIIKTVIPVTLMFTTMIATNNICLKFVSLTFYYVGRSLTTIFNVILTYFILGEKTSWRCVLCCILIIFGFHMGVDQESLAGSLSVIGTIFGVISSLSLSMFSIYTKKVLPKIDHNIWALSYCNNVYSTIIFIPIMIANGELSELQKFDNFWTLNFWGVMTIGGIFGFSVGFLTSLQIKYTSALTHNISGTAKACAQTVLAAYWYQEVRSLLWWTSNFIILFGSALYARIKQLDMQKVHFMRLENEKV